MNLSNPTDGSALDDRAVAELRHYRRSARLGLLTGVLLLALFLVLVGYQSDKHEKLDGSGARVAGEVLRANRSEVRIAFDLAGTSRRGRVYLNDSSPEYHSGQAVTVLVDPDDPRTLTIEGEENAAPLAVLLFGLSLVTGVLILIISGFRLGGASDQKRLLARSRWRTFPVHYRMYQRGRGVTPLYLLGPDPDSSLLVAGLYGSLMRAQRSGIERAAEVELAGDPRYFAVLRVPGNEVLLSARPPLNRFFERRWRQAFLTKS